MGRHRSPLSESPSWEDDAASSARVCSIRACHGVCVCWAGVSMAFTKGHKRLRVAPAQGEGFPGTDEKMRGFLSCSGKELQLHLIITFSSDGLLKCLLKNIGINFSG